MDMDERKLKILQAIIDDYINTGEPVGSRTLSKKYNLGISSATIRNEMSDLEDMGYLIQLHTSSGRIPSDKAYRLYVDKLIEVPKLTIAEERAIKKYIVDSAMYEVDKVLKCTASILSSLTGLASIVNTPTTELSYIKAITLLPVNKFNVLLTIITDSGVIRQKVLRTFHEVKDDILTELNNLISTTLKGATIDDITHKLIAELKAGFSGHEDIFMSLLQSVIESLQEVDLSKVYIDGAVNILNFPEYQDIAKAKSMLTFLENEESLKNLLQMKDKFSIVIGSENNIQEAQGCAIITTTYGVNGRTLGTIGIIGPTRMQYSKVISILSNTVNELNKTITKNYEE